MKRGADVERGLKKGTLPLSDMSVQKDPGVLTNTLWVSLCRLGYSVCVAIRPFFVFVINFALQ